MFCFHQVHHYCNDVTKSLEEAVSFFVFTVAIIGDGDDGGSCQRTRQSLASDTRKWQDRDPASRSPSYSLTCCLTIHPTAHEQTKMI